MGINSLEKFRYSSDTPQKKTSPAPSPAAPTQENPSRKAPEKDNANIAEKIEKFSHGDTTILDSPELVEGIADYLFKLYLDGDMRQALLLLECFGEAALNKKIEHRERSLIVLSLVAEKVLEENNEDLLEAIAQMLVRWLKKETEFIAGFEFICAQLSKLIQKMLDVGLWYQAEDLIAALQSIRIGDIPKKRLFRQIVKKSQRSIAEKRLLDALTYTYMKQEDEKSNIAGTLLLQFGDNSVPHLLNTLLRCQDRSLRYRLLELIPEAGAEAVPHLVRELESSSPWYFTRNLLHILGKIADPAEISAVTPFLKHEDIRIQWEAVEYLDKMQDDIKRSRLLEALKIISDSLKPEIIEKLGPLQNETVNDTFVGLLNDISSFTPELQNEIVLEICKYLADYPRQSSLAALDGLLADEKQKKNFTDKTLSSINKCRNSLEKYLGGTRTKPEENGNSSDTGQAQADLPSGNVSHDDETELAIPQWLRHFCEQEDSPPELIKHLHRRKEFYTQLDKKEFEVLTGLLNHRVCNNNEVLTSIGDVHSTLFFIEGGEVRLDFPRDDSKIEISKLKAGDLFGHYIFMNGSEWEVSLTAIGEVEAYTFDQEQLLRLQTDHGHLCQLLLEYCKTNDVIMKLFEASDVRTMDNSAGTAVPLNGDIGDHIADTKITCSDPSGICFCLVIPDGTDHTLFAEKNLIITMKSDTDERSRAKARVLGLRYFPEPHQVCIMAGFSDSTELANYSIEEISLSF